MKRMTITGILALATGMSLMAQAQPQGQPGLLPGAKSKAESEAVMALVQSQGNPDATIKAAEDLLSKFADSQFKETALYAEANAYQMKNDAPKAQIYAEKTLEANPKNFQAMLMLGELTVSHVRDNDLDRNEKLAQAEKYFTQTIETLKTAPKPNPQITDAQWDEGKKFVTAEAHSGLGMVQLSRKKYDVAATEFKTAVEGDPQPTYNVRLAMALQQGGKNEEALAIVDKLLADPQLHPQIKQVAQSIKTAATAAKK